MLQVYYLEERIKTFVRAGKVSFHASTRGHEKVSDRDSYLLEPGKDWFFPYYREKALMLGLGMSSQGHLSAHAVEGGRPLRRRTQHGGSRCSD